MEQKMNAKVTDGWDALWVNANLATLSESAGGYGAIREGAIAVADGRIVWLGKMKDLPDAALDHVKKIYDAKGYWLTPGLIDCHTHLIYGGNRAKEFELLLKGANYRQIAESGGGIRATVSATREASEQELVTAAGRRLQALLHEGVTTVEIKSGYGLQLSTELAMLRAAKKL